MMRLIINERRTLVMLRYLPWPLFLVLGRLRRNAGHYDKLSYACFYYAWKRKPSLSNLLAYLKFRRDLGLVMPSRFKVRLKQALPSATKAQQHKIINWLIESDIDVAFDESVLPDIQELTGSSPPAAAYVQKKHNARSLSKDALSILQCRQESWREEFVHFIRNNRHSICVVGNSANTAKQNRGDQIDRHGIVIRFNQYAHGEKSNEHSSEKNQRLSDVGGKIDVWVRAPGYNGPALETAESADWIIITGPDVRYQLSDWGDLSSFILNQKKVITIPLNVWRKLVTDLQAPPSAGILISAWLIKISEQKQAISVTGFQQDASEKGRHHHDLPRQKASQRHNWVRERALLLKWQRSGLLVQL
jgi:hypothetical protein